MKKLITLMIAMLCIVGKMDAKVQLSLWTLGKSWNTSYEASTKTITFSNSNWDGGCGWDFGSKDISSTPYLVIEFDNLTQEVAVQYEGYASDGTTSENHKATSSNIASGTSVAYVDLSSSETYTLKKAGNAYLQAGTAGDVKIKDAYLLTNEEYTEHSALNNRSTQALSMDFTSGFENWNSTITDNTDKTAKFADSGQAFGWTIWGAPAKEYVVFKFDGTQTACVLRVSYQEGSTSKTASDINISEGQKILIVDVSDYTYIERFMFYGNTYNGDDFVETTIKFVDAYYTSLSENLEKVYLGQQVKVTIGSTGYATFSSSSALDFSGISEFSAYVAAEGPTTSTITLTSVDSAPANTGLILKGTAGTYWVPTTDSATSATSQFTASVGATNVAASTDGAYNYIFAVDESDNVGFYKLTANHTLAANKAYLTTTTDITPSGESSAPRRITLDFGDGTTAVLPIENDFVGQQHLREDGVYYTLQGTRVQNPSKGLYILNGKKVLVK